MIDHLGPPIESWWRDLGDLSFTPKVKFEAMQGVEDELGGRSLEAVQEERDDTLIHLLALKAQALERFADEDRWEELLDPVFPPGNPEHIADLVAFLASDLSGNTTGTIVTVDGGSSVR